MKLAARLALLAVATLLAACAARRVAPPPADLVRRVALLPPYDPPDRSAVTRVFTFYSWVAETRQQAPTMLAQAVAAQLQARGIAVVDADRVTAASGGRAPQTLTEARALIEHAGLDVPALYLNLEKYEASDHDFPAYVDVALDATLLAPGSGAILWTTHRAARPVATRGSTSLPDAYQSAATTVAADLVGDWGTATADRVP